jgi:hypothetical protein
LQKWAGSVHQRRCAASSRLAQPSCAAACCMLPARANRTAWGFGACTRQAVHCSVVLGCGCTRYEAYVASACCRCNLHLELRLPGVCVFRF